MILYKGEKLEVNSANIDHLWTPRTKPWKDEVGMRAQMYRLEVNRPGNKE